VELSYDNVGHQCWGYFHFIIQTVLIKKNLSEFLLSSFCPLRILFTLDFLI
jgi:hypothetical protein